MSISVGNVEFITKDTATHTTFSLPEIFADKVDVPAGALVSTHRYFPTDDPGAPECTLNETPAPTTTRAHFHEVDQFQLFLPGEGVWYHRHDIGELTVHYTDAYTTYGPFGSRGPAASQFFTLRAVHSSVAGYLPEDRELVRRRRGRRNYEIRVVFEDAPAGEVRVSEVIAPEADGLACSLLCAGAGAAFGPLPANPESCGQYICIVRGSLTNPSAREELGQWSVAWVGQGRKLGTFVSGSDGADLLVLQFPYPTTAASARADEGQTSPAT